jgi:hypothetical protein
MSLTMTWFCILSLLQIENTKKEPINMETQEILELVQANYEIKVRSVEIHRGSINGNCTYGVNGADKKYFLKAVNNLARYEMETALASVDIQLYLLRSGFPAIPLIFTKEGQPCIRADTHDTKHMFVM